MLRCVGWWAYLSAKQHRLCHLPGGTFHLTLELKAHSRMLARTAVAACDRGRVLCRVLVAAPVRELVALDVDHVVELEHLWRRRLAMVPLQLSICRGVVLRENG